MSALVAVPSTVEASTLTVPAAAGDSVTMNVKIVAPLADSACGYGCIASLPDGATGFTTIELKTNFLATALEGTLRAESRLVHGGRTTQIWDATISDEQGKTLALFRCTQLLLYPAN